MTQTIIIGISLVVGISAAVFAYCCCAISGMCSREEEAREDYIKYMNKEENSNHV